jgi:hypothetical protein
MAFSYQGNPYKEQRSLSDYMAVNDARNLQRAQAERTMEASDMAIQAARQKQEMEAVGMGLAGATEQDYPQRRQALLQQGVPEQFLPEQYNPALIDAIMTKTGYKSKPSLAEQLMQPFSMMMQPQMQQPTQEAAPIPTGSITTQPVGNIDQYAVESGVTPPANNASLDDIVFQARAMEAGQVPTPAPNMQGMPPSLPAQIPDTPTLQTTIPSKPFQPANMLEAMEASKARARTAGNQPSEDRKRVLDRQDAEIKQVNDPSQNASNSNVFAMRMMETSNKLQGADGANIDTTLAGFADAAGREVPLVGNYLVSPEYQRAKNLADNWVTANLRKESGAAIPPEELKQEREKYFPIAGDTQETIAQKRELRAIAEEGMRQAAGSLWKYNKAKPSSAANTGGTSGGGAAPKPKFLGFE